MRNPLENEETAFRFVLGTIAYLAPIVIASWIATWLGVIVFVLATVLVIVLVRRGTRPLPADPPGGRAAVEDTPVTQDTAAATGDSANRSSRDEPGEGTRNPTDDAPAP